MQNFGGLSSVDSEEIGARPGRRLGGQERPRHTIFVRPILVPTTLVPPQSILPHGLALLAGLLGVGAGCGGRLWFGRGLCRGFRVRFRFRLGFRLRIRLGIRFRIRLGLRFALGLIAAATVTGRSGRTTLGVVGDVPAAALELDGRGGNHLLDLTLAFGAFRDRGVGEFNDSLESVMALGAFVFVKRHWFNCIGCGGYVNWRDRG